MPQVEDLVHEYCASEHFLFLDEGLKEHAESLLAHWSRNLGRVVSAEGMAHSLRQVARLDVPLDIRKAFPGLLREFLGYLSSTGRFPEADRWTTLVDRVEAQYADSFREDGSVRGETVRRQGAPVGRNDPCPCGSGKKFKKCCMELLGT